ncbi:MAG: tRNA (cytidine(34)-2'-O)-methyltransferase [Clostridia bacterium]|nr:tRNA (cytidine(34)-2'-O)-methyltransferase [Clostridia bacterium]
MAEINIVLVEPEIPQNTGNIARTCDCTGAALHIVKPMGFEIDDRKLKRAGLDYWWDLEIHYYESLDEFLSLHGDKPLCFFTTKSDNIYTNRDFSQEEAWLVFGKETKGLPETLLCNNESKTVRIPMIGDKRSLNLSNSVAIAVYEVLRQRNYKQLKTEGERIRMLNSLLNEN